MPAPDLNVRSGHPQPEAAIPFSAQFQKSIPETLLFLAAAARIGGWLTRAHRWPTFRAP